MFVMNDDTKDAPLGDGDYVDDDTKGAPTCSWGAP